jgi:hypothetical protein
MSLSDLASLGSFVSGVAVLASLVFLYFQVRQVNAQVLQTERNQRAMLQQGRAARAVSVYLEAASTPDLADAVRRVGSDDLDLTPTAFTQFWFWAGAIVQNFEDTYLQHRHGMLDDASFDSAVGLMRVNLGAEGFRAAWRIMRAARTAEVCAFLDRLAEEAATAPSRGDIYQRWRAELELGRQPDQAAA